MIYFIPFLVVLPIMLISGFAYRNRYWTELHSKHTALMCGLTGARAARVLLDTNGLSHIPIDLLDGKTKDMYDTEANVLRLTGEVYNTNSILAVCVACHEVGHAMQWAQKNRMVKARQVINPVTSAAAKAAVTLMLVGILMIWHPIIFLSFEISGAFCLIPFSLLQIFTLHVDLNASKRAFNEMLRLGLVNENEKKDVKKMMNAEALKYVAALSTPLMKFIDAIKSIVGIV